MKRAEGLLWKIVRVFSRNGQNLGAAVSDLSHPHCVSHDGLRSCDKTRSSRKVACSHGHSHVFPEEAGQSRKSLSGQIEGHTQLERQSNIGSVINQGYVS